MIGHINGSIEIVESNAGLLKGRLIPALSWDEITKALHTKNKKKMENDENLRKIMHFYKTFPKKQKKKVKNIKSLLTMVVSVINAKYAESKKLHDSVDEK